MLLVPIKCDCGNTDPEKFLTVTEGMANPKQVWLVGFKCAVCGKIHKLKQDSP